jgi:molybdopterin biosynthesis enzyme MoaB
MTETPRVALACAVLTVSNTRNAANDTAGDLLAARIATAGHRVVRREMFRQLSYQDVGSSTIQSRALAGVANRTLVFCLPGSVGACALAWDRILLEQLDGRHKPCNFASHFRSA